MPDRAVKVDDDESTDTTAMFDFYEPTTNLRAFAAFPGGVLARRASTRMSVTSYDPIEGSPGWAPPVPTHCASSSPNSSLGRRAGRYSPTG